LLTNQLLLQLLLAVVVIQIWVEWVINTLQTKYKKCLNESWGIFVLELPF
jgi:hypothetical protein